jgi:AcrR family transcriptional regulator
MVAKAISPDAHFGLRERKAAQTKVALMSAFLGMLETRRMEEISVKEVCDAIPVSEVTFYNYFPRKQDVIAFHMRLWCVRVQWQSASAGLRGLAAMRQIYQAMAEDLTERPHLLMEAVSFLSSPQEDIQPTEAEVWVAIPGMMGVRGFRSVPLPELIGDRLEESRELGELPSSIDIGMWLPAALTIFFGVPMSIRHAPGRSLAEEYSRQLDVLLESMRRDERRR